MKASELRVKNLVKLFRSPEDDKMSVLKIRDIFFSEEEKEYFVTLRDGFVVNIDTGIIPIPLTEEWLLRFGYKQDGDWFKKQQYHMRKKDNGWLFYSGNDHATGGNDDAYLNYVHQLQNLYFALTGEELEAND